MKEPTAKEKAFVEWLESLSVTRNQRVLAELRRGLMYEEDRLFGLYACIPPRFLAGISNPWEERVYLLVASLYAFHSKSFDTAMLQNERRNLGDSMRLLAISKMDSGNLEELPESVRRRFEGVIGCNRQELPGHIRQLVSLLKGEEIPIDWAKLLYDLRAWEWRGNPVQWNWSKSFFVGRKNLGGEENDVC